MPRKPTRLKFFGIAVRRRTLYALSVFFAVISVPTISWAILVQQTNVSSMEKDGFIAAAAVTLLCALHGWFVIVHHNPIFYRDEARVVWIGGLVLNVFTTVLGGWVADTIINPRRMAYGTPLLLGGALMVFFLIRCVLLGQQPKKGDIVRGESGPLRKKSFTPKPGVPHSPVAAVLGAEHIPQRDEGVDDDAAIEEDSAPTQPRA